MSTCKTNAVKNIRKKFYILFITFTMFFSVLSCITVADEDRPDLIIYFTNPNDLDSAVEDDDITVNVTVENIGAGNISGDAEIEVGLFIDDNIDPISTNITSKISSSGTFDYLNLYWTAEVGNHSLKIKVDYNNQTTESDELNNEDIKLINVEEGPPKIEIIDDQLYISDNIRFGEMTYINVSVKNIGGNTSSKISAELNIEEDDFKQTKSKTDGLQRDEIHNFSFEWTPGHFGNHTILIKVKHGNDVHDQTDPINRYVEPYRLKWWNSNWHYRRIIGLNGKCNYSENVNFTKLLQDLNLHSKTFEHNTIRIVEYGFNGQIIDETISYNFSEVSNFDNKTNAKGVLTWMVTESFESSEEKYFGIYFDVKENNERSRNPRDETNDMISSEFEISYNGSTEGWWYEIIVPINDIYPLNVPITLEVTTTAKAINLTANFEWDESDQGEFYFESDDRIRWIKSLNFTEEGKWTIDIDTKDNAGYSPEDTKIHNFRILAMPDLEVVEIILPSDNIYEGEPVNIHAVINNTGYADAKNYEVSLYLSQDDIDWDDSNLIKDTIKVDVDIDESKEVKLVWAPAIYGDSQYDGKWNVGILIHTNSTNRDSNENNNQLDEKLNVVEPEKNKPVIQILELTDPQERRMPVTITAKVTDESGIKDVNISITDPEDTNYFESMNKLENNRYEFVFEETQILGEYNFSIIAVDDSFYHKVSILNETFEIIEDQTPPTISYFGVYPSVQLKGNGVKISCITTDLSGVKSVKVTITYPDNHSETKKMVNSSNDEKYVFSQTYELLGKYIFYITSEDSLGNTKKTDNKEFWITNDINDTDNDGMPDWWEERYGLNPYDPTDAEQDNDGDGYTNVAEYKNGFNPLKSNSLLQQMAHKLKENWLYFIASCIMFILIVSLSIYGIRRQKK